MPNDTQPLEIETGLIDISVNGQHGSINEYLVMKDVPTFAVITGKNGAGKSQFL